MASVSWRGARAGKAKGRDLLTLLLGHGRALHGTLSGTPEWACLRAPSVKSKVPVLGWSSKFARFEKDSSRSYANCVFVKGYLVIVFFPKAGSLSEAARVGKTEFFGERHLTKGQIQNRGWVGCD